MQNEQLIIQLIAQELSLRAEQIKNALELFAEGATIPFVARYRKERTGEMNEIQLRDLQDRYAYLTELRDRKAVILQAISDQGKLTDALRTKIETCTQKTELEDLYLITSPTSNISPHLTLRYFLRNGSSSTLHCKHTATS